MKKRILIILVTTLVFGAVAQYTMMDISYLLSQHQDQLIRRGRRTGRRRDDQENLSSSIDF